MGRRENIEVLQDTMTLIEEEPSLAEAVRHSTGKQRIYQEGDAILGAEEDARLHRHDASAQVIVSGKRTLEAASAYAGKRIAVHNFASFTNPGGGVRQGSGAQEECLCRCSTLYPCLTSQAMWDGFYSPHRTMNDALYNADLIYTPDVMVVKTDTARPERLPRDEWYPVDVVTCAAPNLRATPSNPMNPFGGSAQVSVTDEELLQIHKTRIGRVLEASAQAGAEVVILGAFGCGVFKNDPTVAAMGAREALRDYLRAFMTVEFAVYCRPGDDANYRAFAQVMRDFR